MYVSVFKSDLPLCEAEHIHLHTYIHTYQATNIRAGIQERLAVVEAEYKIYKEQNKFPHMEQLEQFCRLQVRARFVYEYVMCVCV